ncbi:MAG: hypothetical protein ACKO9S_01370 [Bacteroidota bacterium]
MPPALRNILAVISGFIIGSMLNMSLLGINGSLIPLPEGMDLSNPEGLAKSMALFQPIHFLAPFLAHALGTLVAVWIAVRFASGNYFRVAMIPCVLFLFGGIYMVYQLPAPVWFETVDLLFAYLPMAWIGFKLGTLNKK